MEHDGSGSKLLVTINNRSDLYKRWISEQSILVMHSEVGKSTYIAELFDLLTGKIETWCPGRACGVWAQGMPITYFDADGDVISRTTTLIGPRISTSADRSYICWIDEEQGWCVCNLRSEAVRHRSRSRTSAGDLQAVWLADGEHFVEAVRGDDDWLDKFVVYSVSSKAVSIVRTERVRRGNCIGATAEDQIIMVTKTGNIRKRSSSDGCLLSVVTCDGRLAYAEDYLVDFPPGLAYWEAKYCPGRKLIAWLLHYSAGSNLVSSFWISGTDGQSPTRVGSADIPTELPSGRAAGKNAHDLEWLPDESGVSYVCGNGIYVLPIAVADSIT